MKKICLIASLITVFALSSASVNAQYYFFDGDYYENPVLYEAGVSVNAMNSLTDLGGKKGIGEKFLKDLNLGYTSISGGIFFSVSYKNAVALRLEGTFGKVSSDDKILAGINDAAKNRFNRNLNFRSNISEVAALVEIHPMYIFVDWPAKETTPPRTSPYLLAGVGYFSFNPQTKIGNRTIDLQPLSTEGQGFAEYPNRPIYKLNQLNIPMGAGVKYELSPLVNLRAEVVYRKLFTDYLDDLSTTYIDPALFDKYLTPQKAANAKILYDRQIVKVAGINGKRGTEKNNDAYFTANLKISVIIGRERIRR
ncbi:hypothetical protein ACFOWM_07450 [Ferruginibacter yonginensis]|uniref:Outer membrane protein beta-barrel domain-containing protein n=1 Tax=Ferruginibacter yonginensis TaxID=1310416 RepID=A0ABV8QS86_9BACT